jgi:hypothetical protein
VLVSGGAASAVRYRLLRLRRANASLRLLPLLPVPLFSAMVRRDQRIGFMAGIVDGHR